MLFNKLKYSIIQWQPEYCSYDIVARSGETVFPPFPVDVSQSSGTPINITITLPSNKYFNVTVTAYNAYGNTTITFFMSKSLFMQLTFTVHNGIYIYLYYRHI